jgi:hypothetical protein
MSAQHNTFVDYDADGRFVHYCHCGKWGSFGYGVSLRNGKLGRWYCSEHRPRPSTQVSELPQQCG